MIYDYHEAQNREVQREVHIRLKYERRYYCCEYYDGMRFLDDTLPEGKHLYETRHPDDDITYPAAIAPEGTPVVVNFCGTIICDIPIAINVEKKVMEILYVGDCCEQYAKEHSYNHIKNTNPEVCESRDNGVLRCKDR